MFIIEILEVDDTVVIEMVDSEVLHRRCLTVVVAGLIPNHQGGTIEPQNNFGAAPINAKKHFSHVV